MRSNRSRERLRLSAVLVQNSTAEGSDALERLTGWIHGLEEIDAFLVAVDHRRPGGWMHRVSKKLVQVGGDQASNFSGFDRGVAFLKGSGVRTDVYLFTTEDLLTREPEVLALIDDHVVKYAHAAPACVGLIDADERELDAATPGWLRAGLILMPEKIRSLLGRLETPSDRRAITHEDRRFSARLISAGIAGYDLRLIPGRAERAERDLDWRAYRSAVAQPGRYEIESFECPRTVIHGDHQNLEVAGWVAADPEVETVTVSLCDAIAFDARCEIARPDVVAAFPQYPGERHGFQLRADLDRVPVGDYVAEWSASGTPLRVTLGRLEVRPRLEVVCTVFCRPWQQGDDGRAAVWLRGESVSTDRLDRIEVRWNGAPAPLTAEFSLEEEMEVGLLRYRIAVDGSIEAPLASSRHVLELRFQTVRGDATCWSYTWRREDERPRPIIHVERLEAEVVRGAPERRRVTLAGWVHHSRRVDFLEWEVGGRPVAKLGLEEPRPDVASALGEGLVTRQGFHLTTPIEVRGPGAADVRLVAVERDGRSTPWSGSLLLPESARPVFRIESEDLERIERGDRPDFWSSLVITGQIDTVVSDLVVSLFVDGSCVDQRQVATGSAFMLRYTPQRSCRVAARVTIDDQRRRLYDSGEHAVDIHVLTRPRLAVAPVERLVEEFALFGGAVSLPEVEDLSRRLLERHLGHLSDFYELLAAVERRLDHASSGSGTAAAGAWRAREDLGYSGPPLEVLFAAWEAPSWRHGGGVYMTNLLKGLGDKHRITLVHTYGPEEKQWVNDVRPYLERVVSVPRKQRFAAYHGDSRIPPAYFHNYLPELRRTIEAEIATERYDLVDYEYTMMYPHIPRGGPPGVLAIYELPYLAQRNGWIEQPTSTEEAVARLDDFLRAFYFATVALPATCPHLITLTGEEAASLTSFGVEAAVYVNSVGVDDRFLVPPPERGSRQRAQERTLVFVGNYRHPPNVSAAGFFATQVMPLIRERSSGVRFLIVGSHAPEELRRLAVDDVEVVGFVDDVRPFLWQGAAFVAPIFFGAGMRVKVLEAMACGCPVVSTRLAVQGLQATAGEHFLEGESALDFAEAVLRLLADSEVADRVAMNGRRLVETSHGFESKASERETIWGQIVESSRIGTPRNGRFSTDHD